MKIGQPSDKAVVVTPQAYTSPQKTTQSATASATSGASSAGVAVTVSPLARTLVQVSGVDVDIDKTKVEAVRSAIENGTYVVNPEAIADKLLGNAQEMLNRTRN